jgi:Lrp/AsnC family transcriptional regulator for asnA, asnC and gidA
MSSAHMTTLDTLSQRLIAELQEDGRRSFREIGKRLGVSPNTVRARFNQLRDSGVVEVLAVPNVTRMGLDFHAVVGLRVTPGHAEEVADLLSRRPEISWIGLVSTGYDVMFELSLGDSRSFGVFKQEVLARIPQCLDSDTFLLWDVPKFRYTVAFPARTTTGEAPKQRPESTDRHEPGPASKPLKTKTMGDAK